MAIYYYWGEDWSEKIHSEDVYLLAPVTGATDVTNPQDASTKTGLKLNGNLSLTVGGPSIQLDSDEWNIKQRYVYDDILVAPDHRSAVSFSGNGTLRLTAKTGGSGTVARVVGRTDGHYGTTYSYEDKNIRISSYNLSRSTLDSYAQWESTWYLVTTESNKYHIYYPTSGAIADSSAVYASKTLTIGSSFNGYLQAQARNFSHGGWVQSGTAYTLYDSANSTSTVAVGLQAGTTVAFEANFFGSMDISARADLASFATRKVTSNTIAAYAVSSPAGVEMKNGLWNGQIKASVHSNTLDATKAYVHSGTAGWVEVAGSGTVSGNMLESGAVKSANGSIYINRLDSRENDDRTVEKLKNVDYDVFVDTASVRVEFNSSDGEHFKETDGESSGVRWNQDAGTVTFVYDGSATISSAKLYVGDETIEFTPILQTFGGGTTYQYVFKESDWNRLEHCTTKDINDLVKEGSADIDLYFADGGGDYVHGTYERNDTITWTRSDEANSGGVLITYAGTSTKLNDNNDKVVGDITKDVTVYVDYAWQNDGSGRLTYDGNTYTYHPKFGSLFNDGKSYCFLVENDYDEYEKDGSPTYTYSSEGDPIEYGVQDYSNVRGHHDTGTGSYVLTWLSDENVDSENEDGYSIDMSYLLGDDIERKTITFNGETETGGITSRTETYASAYDGKTIRLYRYTASTTDTENLQSWTELDKNIVIYAEAKKNELVVGGGGTAATTSLSGNTIQSVGLDAANELTLNFFTEGTTIHVETCDNSMSYSGGTAHEIYDNQISSIGIRGKTVTLQDFYGTVEAISSDNHIKYGVKILSGGTYSSYAYNKIETYGIRAENLTANSNLDGVIRVESDDNGGGRETTAGYYVTGNMKVSGVLNTDVTVTADDADIAYGYYVGNTLLASCYAGTTTLSGYGTQYGIYAKTLHSNDGDLFVVGGTIDVSASSNGYGIAVISQADLLLKGLISVSGSTNGYAVHTDYGKSVSSGFSDDRVELDAGSDITGIINMGGGKNTFIVNSEASYKGYVEHSVGTTNVIYRLAGRKNDVVSTITSERDASLTSGATITLDCSNVTTGVYQLMQYEEGKARTAAASYWNNANITVAQNGATRIFSLHGGSVTGTLSSSGLKLTVKYDQETGIVSANVTDAGTIKDCSIFAVGLEDGEVKLYQDGETENSRLLAAYNNLLKNSGTELVNTTQDVNTGVVSSSVALHWMQWGSNTGKFELTYGIYRKDGSLYAENTVRLEADKAKQVTESKLEDYNLYAYTVKCVPEGCTVKWSVRDYLSEGNSASKSTVECELSTSVQERSESAELEVSNLLAVNPDDSTEGLKSAVVKFTWDAPEGSIVVDHYTVEFFNSVTQLNAEERKEVFAAYARGKKVWTILHSDDPEAAYGTWVDIYEDGRWYFCFYADGDVRVKNVTTSGEEYIYNYTVKDTTATEILATDQNNQGYVYWHVKAVGINPDTGTLTEGSFVDGITFQVFTDDTTGPNFDSSADVRMEASVGFKTDEKTGKISGYTLKDISWYEVKNNKNNSVQAKDDEGGSGTCSYTLQYKNPETNVWTNLHTWEASEIYDEAGNFLKDKLSEVTLPGGGSYTLRVIARDMAGNEGTVPTKSSTVYAQDTLAPVTVTVTPVTKAEYMPSTTDLKGYHYTFTWDATADAAADSKNISTGLHDYTITWKYTDGNGDTKYLEKYTVYGIKDGEPTLLADVTPDDGGKTQLTGDALNYDSYLVSSDELLAYKDEKDELTGNKYSFSVVVSDVAGNTATLIDESELKIDTAPDIFEPKGAFSKLSSKVAVTSREEVIVEAGSTYEGETTRATSADVTFQWTDNYTDESGVRYLLQFSDSADYNSSRTYTFLVMNSSDSTETIAALREDLWEQGTYRNLRVATEESSKTLVFGNTHTTVNSGLFSGLSKVYWRMKALDLKGNQCSEWSGDQTFAFTDSERYNEIITDIALPAEPVNLKISKDTFDSTTRRYTGDVELSYYTEPSGFGVSYSVITLANTKTQKATTKTVEYVNGGTGNGGISTELSTSDNKLADGNYVIRVTNYGAGGSTISSGSVTFLQDCTAPTAVDSLSASVLPTGETYITWTAATDAGSGVDHYSLCWKKYGTEDWMEETVAASSTTYRKSLTVGSDYDFKVTAVDKKGNYGDATTVSKFNVVYTDIDATGDYDYQKGAFAGELIGLTDESDIIKVATEGGNGLMEITISNLSRLIGSGSLEVTVLNSQKTAVKKWTLSAGSDASSAIGKRLQYYYTGDSSDTGYIRIRSNSSTALQYALAYAFTAVDTTEKDNTAYGTDHVVKVSADNTGTVVASEDGWLDDIQVSCGNADDYARLSLTHDGKYTFTLSKQTPETSVSSLDTAKLIIYKTKAGSTALTAVKTVTLSASAGSVQLANLLLDAGEYFIRVNAPKASSGANLAMTLGVDADQFLEQNTQDDTFGNLPDDYRADSGSCTATAAATVLTNENVVIDLFKYSSRKVAAARTLSFAGHNFLQGEYTSNNQLDYEWVGYGDTQDFKAFEVTQGGTYRFSLLKAADLSNFSSTTGALNLTVYKLKKEGDTSLSKVGSVSLKDQNREVLYFDGTSTSSSSAVYTLSQLALSLTKGTYYVSVSSANAARGDSISYALVADVVQRGNAPEIDTIEEAKADKVVITENGTTVLSKTIIENGTTTSTSEFQDIGINGDTVWYNLTALGTGNHSFQLTKKSASASDATLTVTLYRSDKTGTKMNAVKSVTVAASDLGQTFTVSNLAAGDYFVRVYAKNGASGRMASYTLSDTVSGLSPATVLTTTYWFAGAKDMGTFEDDVRATTKTLSDAMLLQSSYYACFNTGNWAGEFQLSSNQNKITAYILKNGATSLTKLSGTNVFLEAHTTCYVALANNGIGATADLKVTRGAAARIVSDDNNWAELAEEYQLCMSDTTGVSWSGAVGYGDLLSSRQLVLTSDGSYNFSLRQTSTAGISPKVTMTLYKWNKNGTGLSKVKTLKAGSVLSGVLLEAGEYYVTVCGSKSNGYAGYEAAVTAGFLAPVDKDTNDTPADATQVSVESGVFDSLSGWVGYNDAYDYYQLKLDEYSTGNYSLRFSMASYSNLTLYAVSASDSSLKAIYKYDCKVSGKTESADLKLRADTNYILAFRSTNASKGGNCNYSFSMDAFHSAFVVKAFPLEDNPNNRVLNLSSIGNSSAEFKITESTKGTYTFSLGYGHSLLKYNTGTGLYTSVKLNGKGQAKLAAGTYLIDGLNADKNSKIVFDTANKIVSSETTDSVTSMTVKNLSFSSGTQVSQKYCLLKMEENSTGDYSYTISSTYAGTMYLYVRDAGVPDCGMRQLARYDLVADSSGKYTATEEEILLSQKSEYVLEFVSTGSSSYVNYVLNQNAVQKTMKQLSDGGRTDAKEVFVDVTEEMAGQYTVDLQVDQQLNLYHADTGVEETLFTATGSSRRIQTVFSEGDEYFIRGGGSEGQYLFTLDSKERTLSVLAAN